jgi:hypothetical protein
VREVAERLDVVVAPHRTGNSHVRTTFRMRTVPVSPSSSHPPV